MKELYLDLGMGAAGDMLSGALYDLLDEEKRSHFLELIRGAGIPGVQIEPEKAVRSGITGTQFHVRIHGTEEVSEDVHGEETGHTHGHGGHGHDHGDDEAHGHDHGHGEMHGHDHHHADLPEEHDHMHEHHHHHTDSPEGHDHTHGDHVHEHGTGHAHHHHEHHGMDEIRNIIGGLRLPDPVKKDVLDIYQSIADAESRVHGIPVGEVHLHEVGMLDAVADISSCCLLIHMLQPDRITATPVTTGFGAVRCAHGILPVPAPATALLLEDLPVRTGMIEGELCTPTGAALVRHFVQRYAEDFTMVARHTGYGMGKKEFERLNCVRAIFGDTQASAAGGSSEEAAADDRTLHRPDEDRDTVIELACNLDDMTGEELGFAAEELLKAGAADVWMTPVQMKKNRPGTVLTLLCREEDRDCFVRLLFRLTSTIGIRETLHRRYILDRTTEEKQTPQGLIRSKKVSGYGVCRRKSEYEDLAAVARQNECSLRDAAAQISED